ncbi:hypothetical protein VM1G_07217 [Cytospora mali]|uniref:Uncharacterized protein n=1 Tax=Cytospora mali TaxID=578113 RepID=A0A194W4P5_CYTMA|nr:hypothetical protein VM1G_07217 [Valsa mali]
MRPLFWPCSLQATQNGPSRGHPGMPTAGGHGTTCSLHVGKLLFGMVALHLKQAVGNQKRQLQVLVSSTTGVEHDMLRLLAVTYSAVKLLHGCGADRFASLMMSERIGKFSKRFALAHRCGSRGWAYQYKANSRNPDQQPRVPL